MKHISAQSPARPLEDLSQSAPDTDAQAECSVRCCHGIAKLFDVVVSGIDEA